LIVFFGMAWVCSSLDVTGALNHLSAKIFRRVEGSPKRMFVYTFAMSCVVTLFASNDIVILTLTPIVAQSATKFSFAPNPFLITMFFAANVLSASLLTGNPTNFIIGSALNVSFIEYAKIMLPVGIVTCFVTFACLALWFRSSLVSKQHLPVADVNPLPVSPHLLSYASSQRCQNEKSEFGKDARGSNSMVVVEAIDIQEDFKSYGEPDRENAQNCASSMPDVDLQSSSCSSCEHGSEADVVATLPAELQSLPYPVKAEQATTLMVVQPITASMQRPMDAFLIDPLGAKAHATILILALILLAAGSPFGFKVWYVCLGAACASLVFNLVRYPLHPHSAQTLFPWLGHTHPKGVPTEAKISVWAISARLPWKAIPFVCSMFILVGGLQSAGWIDAMAAVVGPPLLRSGPYGSAIGMTALTIALCSVMNNQPATIFLVRILQSKDFLPGLTASGAPSYTDAAVSAATFGCILGANLGANLTFIGALAGIMFDALVRSRLGSQRSISFLEFGAAGLATLPAAVAIGGVFIALQS